MPGTSTSPVNHRQEGQRDLMKSYWASEHGEPTLENMMLDSNAAEMDILERPEILSELPSLTGRKVLELGAGIGRFSHSLAQKALDVIAVDFVEASCETNRKSNAALVKEGKLQVICEDATKLEFKDQSFDVVFSNWLLMYLGDKEVENLAQKMLQWLRPGGKLFFRESCFHRSGNASRSFNPTQYRHPKQYFDMFNSARTHDASKFNLLRTSCVDTYVKVKDNPNQLWWIWEKCDPVASRRMSEFLDRHQYHYHNVLRYERLFGDGFISVGSGKILDEFSEDMKLSKNSRLRVLDVGCGVGGSSIHLAKEYGCYVHGVDISGVMISIMAERLRELDQSVQGKISFVTADIFEKKFFTNIFDVIICRDFLMHCNDMDKRVVLTKFKNWLVPGGSLFITDYTRGPNFDSECDRRMFDDYICNRGYSLIDVSQEHLLIKSIGFVNVNVHCKKDQFVEELSQKYKAFVDRVRADEKSKAAVAGFEAEQLCEAILNTLKSSPPISQALRSLGPLADECLDVAGDGAINNVMQFFECQRCAAELAQLDFEWVDKYWNIKIQAALQGLLGWTVFTARKQDL